MQGGGGRSMAQRMNKEDAETRRADGKPGEDESKCCRQRRNLNLRNQPWRKAGQPTPNRAQCWALRAPYAAQCRAHRTLSSTRRRRPTIKGSNSHYLLSEFPTRNLFKARPNPAPQHLNSTTPTRIGGHASPENRHPSRVLYSAKHSNQQCRHRSLLPNMLSNT